MAGDERKDKQSAKKMRHINKLSLRKQKKEKAAEILIEFASLFSEHQLRRNHLWYYVYPAERRGETYKELHLGIDLLDDMEEGDGDFVYDVDEE